MDQGLSILTGATAGATESLVYVTPSPPPPPPAPRRASTDFPETASSPLSW